MRKISNIDSIIVYRLYNNAFSILLNINSINECKLFKNKLLRIYDLSNILVSKLSILQEARALLGRLEYQRGNVEAALQVFDGIDISTVRSRMKSSSESRGSHRRGRSKNEFAQPLSLHAAGLLLEAIYLKAKSLQKLGRLPGKTGFQKSKFYIPDFLIFLYLFVINPLPNFPEILTYS